ncbi:hypothetical protein [Bacillus pseudomycoides]|uniref:hypothetical protein n=1 Tax=Bacillus pseudomycoides TaxID=64104 RepID=UPI0004ED8384|nr:hypothetical protein [Bacillus pseudomycoides]AIK40813.1 putative membrane protein [Bacillus pseudomycoides]AJI19498.1 putative membrane protein [Bacillus pseudomycoides]MEB3052738.1 hypothetical protein [Bacillus pseudomycoides]PEB39464.1 hypothetical protein COO06_22840 [Bacillus pseudomycoides]PGD97887.1 hypothetical protein COM50_11625 [Bacillus pseudomycoides]
MAYKDSLFHVVKDKIILTMFILLTVFHMINFVFFFFFAVTVALFWDDPNADMSTEYAPIVMPYLYPVLIGGICIFLAFVSCYFYQKYAPNSKWKKVAVEVLFLIVAFVIPRFFGAFKIPLLDMLSR